MELVKYSIVLIDSDETIFDYQKCERHAFIKTIMAELNDNNVDYSEKLYAEYKIINKKLWIEYHKGLISKNELLKNRFTMLFNKFNLEITVDKFSENYLIHLSESTFLMPYAKDVIREISEHIKIVIVTNGVAKVHKNRIMKSEISEAISNVFVSGEFEDSAQYQKPNPIFFEYIHKIVAPNIEKNKILMIGDSLESDVAGGNNYGIDTCWYNYKRDENRSNIKPTYEVACLKEIPNIIFQM